MQIIVGLIVMIGVAGFLMAALRPGRVVTPHIIDNDRDGEPDASPAEKRATMDEDREYQRQLHGD